MTVYYRCTWEKLLEPYLVLKEMDFYEDMIEKQGPNDQQSQ